MHIDKAATALQSRACWQAVPAAYLDAEAGPGKHREGYAILGARVGVEHHGCERDDIAYEHCDDSLCPGHACRDQSAVLLKSWLLR